MQNAICDMRLQYEMWKHVECWSSSLPPLTPQTQMLLRMCTMPVFKINNLVQSCVGEMSNILSHNGFIVGCICIFWWPCLEAFEMLWLFVCWHHRQPNVNVIIKHQTDFPSFYSFAFHMGNGKMSKTEFVKGEKEKNNNIVSVYLL